MSKDYVHQTIEMRRLRQMDGWPMLCAAFAEEIGKIEEKIFDTKTGAEETVILKETRAKLKEMTPDKLADRMIRIGEKNSEKRNHHDTEI